MEKNYKDLKTLNPKFPILIRECSGVEPQLWARYGISMPSPTQMISFRFIFFALGFEILPSFDVLFAAILELIDKREVTSNNLLGGISLTLIITFVV